MEGNLRLGVNKKQINQNLITKIVSMAILVLFIFMANPALAITQQEAQTQINQINQQIGQINNSLAENQQQQQTVKGEIAVIDAQVQTIQLQINATQYQIDITNAQIEDTNAQITKAEEDLANQKRILGEYLRTMYMEGQTSTMELIATSNSLSDFVDRSEYLNTMQQKISETTKKIAALKTELEQKKTSLEVDKAKNEQLRASQVAQRSAIQAQQSYKNSILSNAAAEAKTLSGQKDSLYAKKAQLSLVFNENVTKGGSGYPYGNPPSDALIDTPDAYGYLIGECTGYSAWKRSSLGNPVPRGLGNANTWGSRAAAMGYPVDSNPQPGDVMVFPYIGGYGHVAIVESVNGNGTVNISEYNWVPYSYTYRSGVNPFNYGAVFIH